MFEKDLPGGNTAGFNAESEVGELPLETCDTINGAWGYNSSDKRYKSTQATDPVPGAGRRATTPTSC